MEEDPYRSMEIFAQCVTRTLTTKGLVTLTATPENGDVVWMTGPTANVYEGRIDLRYFQG